MGHASIFHDYVDSVDIVGRDDDPPKVLIVGPGNDQLDVLYWSDRVGASNVTTIGPGKSNILGVPHIEAMFSVWEMQGTLFDVVWCTHVLEHALNVNIFLTDLRQVLHENGHAFIAVPPHKPQIVGGHVNLFNMGLLMYRLVLAGFDCRNGAFKRQAYNLFAHVRRGVPVGRNLNYDAGDIEILSDLFPMPVQQGFNGEIDEVNWEA